MHGAVVTGTQGSVCCDMSDSNTCGAATSCVPSHSGGAGGGGAVCYMSLYPTAFHVSCKSNKHTDGVKRPSQQTNKQSLFYLTTVFVNGLGIEFRWGRDFPHMSRPGLGPTQPPVQCVSGLSRG